MPRQDIEGLANFGLQTLVGAARAADANALAGPPQALNLAVLGLKPGDFALLRVQIVEEPASDGTAVNVAVAKKGFTQRFWVPTSALRAEREAA